jgi:hypothetical protein
MKAIGQLTKNPPATFEMVTVAMKLLKKKFPKNPFIPNFKDEAIMWGALTTVNATDVR